MKPTNLNQLKNYLQVGTKLKLADTSLKGHKYLGTTRSIEKKQTNSIKFEGGSWLYLEKASDFSFQDNGFTQHMTFNGQDMGFLKYEYEN